MKNVALKGTQSGFEITMDDNASFASLLSEFKALLDNLVKNQSSDVNEGMAFDIKTGNRSLSETQKQQLRDIVKNYKNLGIHEFTSNVMSNDEAYHLRDENRVTIIDQTIRNGQEVKVKGDVLFLGKIHEGGKLITDGNVFNMGYVEGIVQVGYPADERKLAAGNFHDAQQVRIGEQIEIIADKRDDVSENVRTVLYVNDLHNIDYGNLDNLKAISPKFFNRIGGI